MNLLESVCRCWGSVVVREVAGSPVVGVTTAEVRPFIAAVGAAVSGPAVGSPVTGLM